jgi:hypothetical protein
VVGLEVDTDHRTQLQVDEQQQDVIDAGCPLATMSTKDTAADQNTVAPMANSAR